MSAETLLNTALLADAALVAAVSAERIASDYVAQELGLPAVVTMRAGTEYVNTIHGAAPVASDATMDIWCMDARRVSVENVADLVVTACANAGFLVVDRRQEFEVETLIYITIVTCEISL